MQRFQILIPQLDKENICLTNIKLSEVSEVAHTNELINIEYDAEGL